MLPLTLAAIIIASAVYLYRRGQTSEVPEQPKLALSDDQVRQQWRKLGFYCELDDEKRVWKLTGSRAGLLYFPDLLLGYVNDPRHAADGAEERFGPYGSLEIMTYPDAAFAGNAIRGSLDDLTRLAELIEAKLATAEPGAPIQIREEYAPDSRYTLLLDVKPDGFDPASAEHMGTFKAQQSPKPTA